LEARAIPNPRKMRAFHCKTVAGVFAQTCVEGMARMEAKPWPSGQGQGAIAINAYAAMSDLLMTLPEEEGQAEILPPFYALPEPPPEPDPILPLNAYNLSQLEGRFAFLRAL